MTVLVYAVTDDLAAGPETDLGRGLGAAPLRTVRHHRLRAVVSDHAARVPVDEASLWSYEGVVEGLMRAGTILPARFGTAAADDGEIMAMLSTRGGELARSLERVRYAVEFAVRSPDSPEEHGELADPDRPGTAYLRRRLAQKQDSRRLADLVAGVAGELVRETERRAFRPLAVLVDRRHVPQFTARFRARGLILTGPWPPYSFVDATP